MSSKKRCMYAAALLAIFLCACSSGTGAGQETEASVSEQAAAGETKTAETDATAEWESAEGKQVRMTAQDVEVLITLNDSKAAADFVTMLPLELTLIERNSFAKGMMLPRALDTQEETTREYEIGDFGYWDAGPDLAIFYDDIYDQTIVPVIPLGKAEVGAEKMRDTSGTVRLELVTE